MPTEPIRVLLADDHAVMCKRPLGKRFDNCPN